MKITISLRFTVILIFTITSQLNAQKMVEVDNQWNMVVYPTFSPDTESYSIKIGEDTIVNDLTYNKVYLSQDSLNTDWQFFNLLLREDSTKKVYSYQGHEEVLLYDFSLELNDTFLIEDVCTLIVNEVDSVILNNGEIRKRLTLGIKDNPLWGETTWIDGIGSTLGVISHFKFCYLDYAESLLCFYSEFELLYPDAPPSCFITPIKEIQHANIKIYPNPSRDVLTILSDEAKLKSYIIYTVTGTPVREGLITGFKNDINLLELNGGLYILTLTDNEGHLYSYKLIKE